MFTFFLIWIYKFNDLSFFTILSLRDTGFSFNLKKKWRKRSLYLFFFWCCCYWFFLTVSNSADVYFKEWADTCDWNWNETKQQKINDFVETCCYFQMTILFTSRLYRLDCLFVWKCELISKLDCCFGKFTGQYLFNLSYSVL